MKLIIEDFEKLPTLQEKYILRAGKLAFNSKLPMGETEGVFIKGAFKKYYAYTCKRVKGGILIKKA